MTKITRTFDVLTNAEENYNYDVALSVKRNGKWENFSTAEYRKHVDDFSLGLLAMGFKKGDKIASVTNNRPEWNFIDFGMSQIGCVHVGIYPTISETEFSHILSHSDAKIILIADVELYEKIKPVFDKTENLKEIYTFDEVKGVKNWKEICTLGASKEQELRPSLEKQRDDVKPDDLLTLIYTSGTTGLSKGVMLTHNNVVSNVLLAFQFATYLNPGDRALSFLPLSHILERLGNYVWQAKGLIIYYAESIETIGENMREIKVNTFITVPRVFEKVYDKIINKGRELSAIKKMIFFWAVNVGNQYDPDPKKRSFIYNKKLALANKLIFSKWREALGGELKGVIAGGAALQPRLARIFWAARIIVQEGYGLTETSPLISANNSYFPWIKFGSVGVVPKEVDVKIAEDGEILAKGENLMKGYYKNPELTSQVIDKDGWFHTGDKTRMEALSTNSAAFIRPSASSGTLGGVARATREAVILCETAGFDIIIIETVGVGQSETAVSQIVDFFLLLMLSGGGDELQGIKRGIMEMADLIVINKADGDNVKKTELSKREFENALHLFPGLPNGWTPKALTASALYSKGLIDIWATIEEFITLTKGNGFFKKHRNEQSLGILKEGIEQGLTSGFFRSKTIKPLIEQYEQQILNAEINPYEAAQLLLSEYFEELKKPSF